MRAVGVAILSLLLVWWIGANVFLSTSLFERVVNQDPRAVEIHFARAWSWWPGQAHAEKLSIRGTDSNIEWVLTLDDVDFDVSLPLLTKRHFHITRARGSGIAFRGRLLVESPRATPEYVAQLPPIPGLPAVAFRPSEPPPKEVWSDADWDLWTIQLENVIAEDVREIWIDGARFQGKARIAGGFYLKPIRHVVIGPVEATVQSGGVRLDGKPALESLSGLWGVSVDAFDPRYVHGDDVLAFVSLRTALRAHVPDVANLGLDVPGVLPRGTVDVDALDLHVRRGVLAEPSHVALRAPSLAAKTKFGRVMAHVGLEADVEGSAADARLEGRLELTEVAAPGVRLRGATVKGDAGELALKRLGRDPHVVAGRRMSPSRSARAGVRGAAAPRRAAEVHARAPRSRPLRGGSVKSGHGGGHDRRGAARPARGRRSGAGRGEGPGAIASLRWAEGRVRGAELDVELGRVSVENAAGRPLLLVKQIVSTGRLPSLDLARPDLRSATVRAAVSGGKLPDARALNAFLPPGSPLAVESGEGDVEGIVVLAPERGVGQGNVTVSVRRAGLRLNDARVLGDLRVEGRVDGIGVGGDPMRLGGSRVIVDRARVSGSSADTAAWRGVVDVVRGELALAGGPRVDALVRVDAHDASPLLGLLLQNRLPNIVVDAARMPDLNGALRLTVSKDAMAVRDLNLRGGDVGVQGSWATTNARGVGAFIVRKGPLSVGLDVEPDGTSVRVFGLDGWLADRRRAVERNVCGAPR